MCDYDFSKRDLEFEKEHENGRMMANIHIKATFTAAVDIGLLIRMSPRNCVLNTLLCVKLLVFSF
jgi:hypothetical protein